MSDTSSAYPFLDHELIGRLGNLQFLPRGLVEGTYSGMHRSPHHGASVEFAEYRKYVPGDDTKNIDWRVFAKTDRYYLKQYIADTNMRICFLVDCSHSMAFESEFGTKLDYAKKLMATLAFVGINQGDSVGLYCFNNELTVEIPAKQSPRHLRMIYDRLNGLEPTAKTEISDTLHSLAERIPRRAFIIVISDFFTEVSKLLEAFEHMLYRKHDLALFHLLDKQEVNFDFDYPIKFNDMESKQSLTTEPGNIKQDYIAALDIYLKQMSDGCAEHKVDYQRIITDTPLEDALSSFLLERIHRH
ncbi:MAG: DUF58 domain-containing protein [Lentisphaeria bacterium]|nr:DUF58 domain-containing protein [Lentisphaeria bacterium]NQZ70752.1 DUF58 domain-containing protein [Lentisphaeria bacterium]